MVAHSLFAQRFTRLIAVQQLDHDLTECQDFRKRIASASGLGAGPATASSNAWRHHSLNVCPRRAADFSHCAYSASLSLVPSDRPRNCFGEPFCWVASIKARAVLFQVRPRAGPSCLRRQPLCRGPPGKILLCCPPTGGLNWDATTVSKSAQTKWPSRRINTFAYANRAAPRRALKQRKPLRTKTFAYANGAFPYANPGRGDVSYHQPARSAVFPLCRR